MAYTKAQWDALQAKLPPRERESYETYLSYQTPAPTSAPTAAPAPAAKVEPTPAAVVEKANVVAPVANPIAASVPVAGVVNTPTTPVAQPVSSVPTMPPAMNTPAAPTTSSTTSSIAQVGPLGGLSSGVVAGVLAPTGYTDSGKPTGLTGTTATGVDALVAGGGTLAAGGGNPPSGGNKPVDIDQGTKDAFEEMGMVLRSWGLEDLADAYTRLMVSGKTAPQALTILKYSKEIDPATGQPWNAAYAKRFAGNAARIAAGMNAYSESTYLQIENAYEETLRAYGLSNMLSADRAANQAKFADYMGKGIAPTEFADRIQLVADRVINMDKDIKDTFKTYYPSLTDTDLVTYFLNPKETMPVLKAKVQAAEIGGAAKAQGLGVDEARAMELSKFGIDLNAARTGYSSVAEALPVGKKLSSIYGEEGIAYTQQVAEDEYLKQDAQAKLKRNRLASKERAMFSGQSGADSNSLQRGMSSAF